MIEKAVFSYFNADESFGNKCGFFKYSDFLYTTALSVLCASRLFKEVQIISSSWGVELFKKLKFPATDYSNKLDEMSSVSKYFWAYGKILAYCEQTTPFIHIDNDVFLWEKLPDRILNAPLCFQSHEPFKEEGYKYYHFLKSAFDVAPVRPRAIVNNNIKDYAYNCGICGGTNIKFFKELLKCSSEYIFAPENQDLFFKDFRDIIIHQNLMHEQYFIASLVKKHRLRRKVQVLNKNALKIVDDIKYTHLWGTTKRNRGMMGRVRMRLMEEDNKLFNRVNAFCQKNKIQ